MHSRTDYKRFSDQPLGLLVYLLHHAELHESIVSNTWLLALKHAASRTTHPWNVDCHHLYLGRYTRTV